MKLRIKVSLAFVLALGALYVTPLQFMFTTPSNLLIPIIIGLASPLVFASHMLMHIQTLMMGPPMVSVSDSSLYPLLPGGRH